MCLLTPLCLLLLFVMVSITHMVLSWKSKLHLIIKKFLFALAIFYGLCTFRSTGWSHLYKNSIKCTTIIEIKTHPLMFCFHGCYSKRPHKKLVLPFHFLASHRVIWKLLSRKALLHRINAFN